MALIKAYKGVEPRLHETVFMVESATVIGDTEIGEYSSVWFNAVVRGDVNYIRIGSRTNIQDNSVLHVTHDTCPLKIGNGVTVGHSVTLHGCTVEDNCLIGMGAIVLDNAVIGEGSLVAAGSLVTEAMLVPPGSLVMGLPAKVVRSLTDDERAGLLESAENYIEYARNYMEEDGVDDV
ncbi:MAG: gamma carbonic anhydrase family protein [Thermodesulfobacteriota bacterium]